LPPIVLSDRLCVGRVPSIPGVLGGQESSGAELALGLSTAMDEALIRAPIAKVFEHLSDPDKQKLWMDGLVRTEYAKPPDSESRIGGRFTQHLVKGHGKTAYEFQGEVVEFRKPELYAYRLEGEDFTAQIRYVLEEIDGATRLKTESIMEFKGNIIRRFLGRMAAHHNKQDTKKLIAMLERP